jgi:diguanylate cyclase (GGDEF)-like protein
MMNGKRAGKLERAVTGMTTDELVAAIYMNPYGLQNRRAFNEFDGVTEYVALIDVDSLKWVNDNIGHHAGDALIGTISKALLAEFGEDAYHLSGDEFAVVGNNRFTLSKKLRALQEVLANSRVQSIAPSIPLGLGFSFGIAKSLDAADGKMQQNKTMRTRRGERAVRGAPPPTIRVGENNAIHKTGRNFGG